MHAIQEYIFFYLMFMSKWLHSTLERWFGWPYCSSQVKTSHFHTFCCSAAWFWHTITLLSTTRWVITSPRRKRSLGSGFHARSNLHNMTQFNCLMSSLEKVCEQQPFHCQHFQESCEHEALASDVLFLLQVVTEPRLYVALKCASAASVQGLPRLRACT